MLRIISISEKDEFSNWVVNLDRECAYWKMRLRSDGRNNIIPALDVTASCVQAMKSRMEVR